MWSATCRAAACAVAYSLLVSECCTERSKQLRTECSYALCVLCWIMLPAACRMCSAVVLEY